jgi:hypothetical protein
MTAIFPPWGELKGGQSFKKGVKNIVVFLYNHSKLIKISQRFDNFSLLLGKFEIQILRSYEKSLSVIFCYNVNSWYDAWSASGGNTVAQI